MSKYALIYVFPLSPKEPIMSKVWLVTGSASGLGRDIATAVLDSGARLVATARNPQQLSDLLDRYGDRVRTVALDVTDATAAESAVQVAVEAFGHLDVLVNNAGFAHLGPFEQLDAEDFRSQLETNFFGVVNLTRAALPVMRRQRSGHIIQISSVGGRTGTPGLSAYQAAKWAVGGFTEVLAQEVGHLGIKVTALEPGGMATNWANRASTDMRALDPDYMPSVGAVTRMLEQYRGESAGDPKKVAEVVVRLAAHSSPPPHLLLGSDAVHFAGEADSAREAAGKLWRPVSMATDFAAPGPIPGFPPERAADPSQWTTERLNAAQRAQQK
jgi:NAD(P)-dependent dehydrogenase (short-subunit alcohol dehydrogenase family)